MLEQISERTMPYRQREIRLERNCRVVIFKRLIEPSKVLQDNREVIPKFGVRGADGARPLVISKGVLRAVPLLQNEPDALQRLEMPRDAHKDLFQHGLSGVVMLKVDIGQRQAFQQVWNIRRQFVRALEFLQRAFPHAGSLENQPQIEMGGRVISVQAQCVLITGRRRGRLFKHEKNIAARCMSARVLRGEFERAIKVSRGRSQFATLTEKGPEQVMGIGILFLEIQHFPIGARRTFNIPRTLKTVSAL
jgi:hypothetical protein